MDYKLYKQIRRDISQRIDNSIRYKEKKENYRIPDKYDPEIFNKGSEWFKSGLPLEDAPEDVRSNTHFINGFEKAKRLSMIAELQQNNQKNR